MSPPNHTNTDVQSILDIIAEYKVCTDSELFALHHKLENAFEATCPTGLTPQEWVKSFSGECRDRIEQEQSVLHSLPNAEHGTFSKKMPWVFTDILVEEKFGFIQDATSPVLGAWSNLFQLPPLVMHFIGNLDKTNDITEASTLTMTGAVMHAGVHFFPPPLRIGFKVAHMLSRLARPARDYLIKNNQSAQIDPFDDNLSENYDLHQEFIGNAKAFALFADAYDAIKHKVSGLFFKPTELKPVYNALSYNDSSVKTAIQSKEFGLIRGFFNIPNGTPPASTPAESIKILQNAQNWLGAQITGHMTEQLLSGCSEEISANKSEEIQTQSAVCGQPTKIVSAAFLTISNALNAQLANAALKGKIESQTWKTKALTCLHENYDIHIDADSFIVHEGQSVNWSALNIAQQHSYENRGKLAQEWQESSIRLSDKIKQMKALLLENKSNYYENVNECLTAGRELKQIAKKMRRSSKKIHAWSDLFHYTQQIATTGVLGAASIPLLAISTAGTAVTSFYGKKQHQHRNAQAARLAKVIDDKNTSLKDNHSKIIELRSTLERLSYLEDMRTIDLLDKVQSNQITHKKSRELLSDEIAKVNNNIEELNKNESLNKTRLEKLNELNDALAYRNSLNHKSKKKNKKKIANADLRIKNLSDEVAIITQQMIVEPGEIAEKIKQKENELLLLKNVLEYETLIGKYSDYFENHEAIIKERQKTISDDIQIAGYLSKSYTNIRILNSAGYYYKLTVLKESQNLAYGVSTFFNELAERIGHDNLPLYEALKKTSEWSMRIANIPSLIHTSFHLWNDISSIFTNVNVNGVMQQPVLDHALKLLQDFSFDKMFSEETAVFLLNGLQILSLGVFAITTILQIITPPSEKAEITLLKDLSKNLLEIAKYMQGEFTKLAQGQNNLLEMGYQQLTILYNLQQQHTELRQFLEKGLGGLEAEMVKLRSEIKNNLTFQFCEKIFAHARSIEISGSADNAVSLLSQTEAESFNSANQFISDKEFDEYLPEFYIHYFAKALTINLNAKFPDVLATRYALTFALRSHQINTQQIDAILASTQRLYLLFSALNSPKVFKNLLMSYRKSIENINDKLIVYQNRDSQLSTFELEGKLGQIDRSFILEVGKTSGDYIQGGQAFIFAKLLTSKLNDLIPRMKDKANIAADIQSFLIRWVYNTDYVCYMHELGNLTLKEIMLKDADSRAENNQFTIIIKDDYSADIQYDTLDDNARVSMYNAATANDNAELKHEAFNFEKTDSSKTTEKLFSLSSGQVIKYTQNQQNGMFKTTAILTYHFPTFVRHGALGYNHLTSNFTSIFCRADLYKSFLNFQKYPNLSWDFKVKLDEKYEAISSKASVLTIKATIDLLNECIAMLGKYYDFEDLCNITKTQLNAFKEPLQQGGGHDKLVSASVIKSILSTIKSFTDQLNAFQKALKVQQERLKRQSEQTNELSSIQPATLVKYNADFSHFLGTCISLYNSQINYFIENYCKEVASQLKTKGLVQVTWDKRNIQGVLIYPKSPGNLPLIFPEIFMDDFLNQKELTAFYDCEKHGHGKLLIVYDFNKSTDCYKLTLSAYYFKHPLPPESLLRDILTKTQPLFEKEIARFDLLTVSTFIRKDKKIGMEFLLIAFYGSFHGTLLASFYDIGLPAKGTAALRGIPCPITAAFPGLYTLLPRINYQMAFSYVCTNYDTSISFETISSDFMVEAQINHGPEYENTYKDCLTTINEARKRELKELFANDIAALKTSYRYAVGILRLLSSDNPLITLSTYLCMEQPDLIMQTIFQRPNTALILLSVLQNKMEYLDMSWLNDLPLSTTLRILSRLIRTVELRKSGAEAIMEPFDSDWLLGARENCKSELSAYVEHFHHLMTISEKPMLLNDFNNKIHPTHKPNETNNHVQTNQIKNSSK